MPGIPQGILMAMQSQLMQAQAQDTNAQTALRTKQTQALQMEMDAMQKQQASNQAWQQMLQRQQTTGNPTQNDPRVPSVKVEEESQPTGPDQRLMAQLQDQVRTADSYAKHYNALAAQAPAYGQDAKPFLQEAQRYQRDRLDALKEISTVQERAAKQKKEGLEEIAQLARNWNSPDDVAQGIGQIERSQGKPMADYVRQQMPMDANGYPLWNQQAQKAASNLANQGTAVAQQITEKSRGDTLAFNKDRLDRQREHDDLEDKWHNADIAQRQAGVAAASARAAAGRAAAMERTRLVLAAAGVKYDSKEVGNTQKQLDTLAKDYKIEDYKKGYDIASQLDDKLADPKQGYAAVSAPNARALAEQAKLMMDNYRSRTGGKYQDAQYTRMNSLLDKVEKYVTTIGEGDKILAKDVMQQLTKSMQGMYLDRNADLVKQELSRASTLRRKGQDPTFLTFNGSVDKLVKAGVAKKAEVQGKEYLVFGKGKEDIYEMPSPPERKDVSNLLPMTVETGSE